MLDAWLGPGSLFDIYRSQASAWLREHMDEVSALSQECVDLYVEEKGIVCGWEVKPAYSEWRLYILLDKDFPFSHLQVASAGSSQYLRWPHVEKHGYLCLSVEGWRPIESLYDSIQERINLGIELLNSCQSEDYVKEESAKEFVSYWGRGAARKLLSLIDLERRDTRLVAGLSASGYSLVGETEEGLRHWLDNQGKSSSTGSLQVIFGFISTPPSLPLPRTSAQFINRLLFQCSNLNVVLGRLSPFKDTLVVLASESSEGVGLICAKISAIPRDGFRKGPGGKKNYKLSAQRVKGAWRRFSRFEVIRPVRVDSSWVHGRGQDAHHHTLSSSGVVILGAGSLGSQVAARLAEAGVGNISIIDPKNLRPSNVGRHELGMDCLWEDKAERLVMKLARSYPHSVFKDCNKSWQDAVAFNPSWFEEADLIVSCVGETEQDLSWDRWYRALGLQAPTVYGWLGTQGTTGHALALTSGSSAGLSCFFDPDGLIRVPETYFRDGTQIKAEPGCGTEFQPYGPLAVGHIELLVTRMCLDVLTGKANLPEHRIYTCSSEDLYELGGEWTPEHKQYRPGNYDGPIEYKREVAQCGQCPECQGK